MQTELTSFACDDRTYWFTDVAKRVKSPRVDLVQCYDETIISYTESRDVLQTPDVAFPVPRSIDGFVHVLLCDGRLLGHWRVAGAGAGAEWRRAWRVHSTTVSRPRSTPPWTGTRRFGARSTTHMRTRGAPKQSESDAADAGGLVLLAPLLT